MFGKEGSQMSNFIGKTGFRLGVQIFMVLLVVGMFLAACGGSNDPFNSLTNGGCSSGYTYCSSSGKCCPNGYPYHCDSAGSSYDNTGKCSSSSWTTVYCGSQDYCSG
jgi:hypothetical protein